MACLGWALTSPGVDLVLSGTVSGAPTVTQIGWLMLMGAGRCWWLIAPLSWIVAKAIGV